MTSAREKAFDRSYLVVDECSWGLAIAVKLLLARRNAAEQGRQMDAKDMRLEISNLNKWRLQTIISDKAPLVIYGLLRTIYCRTLERLVLALGVPVPPHLSPSGGSVLLFDEREMPPSPCATRPELIRNRIKGVSSWYIFFFIFCECVNVQSCGPQELADLGSALTALGLASSPAVKQIQRISAAIAKAMAEDTHERSATACLHPSQSLPTAVYGPLAYDAEASAPQP
jgi:hypothetical protein